MNANGAGSGPERSPPLSGFYSYKKTFDMNTVWVDIPRRLTFCNTTNPYLDPGTPDPNGHMPSSYRVQYTHQQDPWGTDHLHDHHLELPPGMHSHGLEALSAAALYSPPEANMIPRAITNHTDQYENPYGHAPSNHDHDHHPSTSEAAGPSNNNLNFLLNPASGMDSPIDPSLMSSGANPITSQSDTSNAPAKVTNGTIPRSEPESEQKVAYLLRQFSDAPTEFHGV